MSTIRFERQNHIARISIERPQVYNALDEPTRNALIDAFAECAADTDVRVVYLTGSGKAFCTGQDLQEVVASDGPSLAELISKGYNPLVTAIRGLEKPVVAAVNGVAAGAGANIALACDLTVATASAVFTQAFSKIGLIPDSGGTWTLPRLVGLQRAMGLMLLSDRLTAAEALTIGMLWKVFPDEVFAEESWKIAETLAQMPPKAMALTKRALNVTFQHDFVEQLGVEDELQTIAGFSDDYREGVAAFLQKRKPVFTGK